MTETLKVIKERSSIRAYTDEKLTKEEINTLIEAGLQAPTAANRQELHFTVLEKGGKTLEALSEDFKEIFSKARNTDKASLTTFYRDAPTVIIISGDKESNWDAIDSGIAVENIALAAQSMGFGSLIIGCIRVLFESEIGEKWEKELFPENYRYNIAVAVGHPATTKEPHEYDKEALVTYLD